MSTRTYSPRNIHITLTNPVLGIIHARGLAAGSFVTVGRDEDAFEKKTGADGEVTRAQTNNRSGFCKVMVDQASPFNDDLNKLADLDETGLGVFTFQLCDSGGNTLEAAGSGWVKKKPDNAFSKKAEDREWYLDLGAMAHTVGGSTIVAG